MDDVDPTGLLESACGAGTTGEWHEAELASELLELSSERELDRFLRDLIRSAAPEAGGAINPSGESALGAILKRAAAQVLPLAGKPLGGTVQARRRDEPRGPGRGPAGPGARGAQRAGR